MDARMSSADLVLRPPRARRSAGPSDDAIRAPAPLQKTRGLPDTPAISAPARPDPPVPSATARSLSISPYPHHRAPAQSRAATWPSVQILLSTLPIVYMGIGKAQMNPLLMTTFMESIV